MVEVSCFSTTTADAIYTAKPCRAACDVQFYSCTTTSVHDHSTTAPTTVRKPQLTRPTALPLTLHYDQMCHKHGKFDDDDDDAR